MNYSVQQQLSSPYILQQTSQQKEDYEKNLKNRIKTANDLIISKTSQTSNKDIVIINNYFIKNFQVISYRSLS